MKTTGWLLLLSGWFVVLATFEMLSALPMRIGFVLAGVGTQLLGLGLVTYSYTISQRKSR